MGYVLDDSRVVHKLLDTSVLARKVSYCPPSLGLRSQTLSLCYVTPEVNGDFFQPKLGRRFLVEQISAKLVQGTKLSSTQIHRQDFIGEIISLIYAPFYTCNNELRDGITGKALGKVDQNDVFEQKNQAAKKQNIFFFKMGLDRYRNRIRF